MIKKFYKETKKNIAIIGVGGVDSGESAFEKIAAGATAIQLYTGMVYKGPTVVKEIKKELISILIETLEPSLNLLFLRKQTFEINSIT